jgi:hypothetical protein
MVLILLFGVAAGLIRGTRWWIARGLAAGLVAALVLGIVLPRATRSSSREQVGHISKEATYSWGDRDAKLVMRVWTAAPTPAYEERTLYRSKTRIAYNGGDENLYLTTERRGLAKPWMWAVAIGLEWEYHTIEVPSKFWSYVLD